MVLSGRFALGLQLLSVLLSDEVVGPLHEFFFVQVEQEEQAGQGANEDYHVCEVLELLDLVFNCVEEDESYDQHEEVREEGEDVPEGV